MEKRRGQADSSTFIYVILALVFIVIIVSVANLAKELQKKNEERQNPPETPIGTTISSLCRYSDTSTGSAKSPYTATGEAGYSNRENYTMEKFTERLTECFPSDTCVDADTSGNCLVAWDGKVSLSFSDSCPFGAENFDGLSGTIVCSGSGCREPLIGTFEVDVKTVLTDYSVTALPDFCIWFREIDSTSELVGAP